MVQLARERAERAKADELARLVAQYSTILNVVDAMRAEGVPIENALNALNMVAAHLEGELREGYQQREEGLALERNHHTEE